jgi:hypothetical protein
LSLESVNYIKSSDSLPAGMLSVSDSVTDDVLKEHFQHTSGLFIDEARDTLDTTSSCETTDCRLRDALDVVSEDLSVPLGTAFA